MPNHKSAIKRNKQSIKRRSHNRTVLSAIRTSFRKVRSFVEEKKFDEAKGALRLAESQVSRAAARGLFHRKTASRRIGRLASMVAKAQKAA
jgi:small subunit ribosomal protein S20